MKILSLVMLFISTTYSQDIVSLSIGNKWSYEYRYSKTSSSGYVSENYFLEKEVVGETYLSGVLYKKINVNKIEEGVSSFVRDEYWLSDSLEFRQIGMDRLYYFSKIFDLTLTNDSIGVDYYIGSQETIIFGEDVLLQKYRYEDSGMENITVEVETARDLGVTRIYEYGSVDTAELTWRYNITLFEALIDGRIITSIGKENHYSTNFILSQNYPNPFNPSTTISYSLPRRGFVELNVYDMLGREVANLVNKEQSTGNYKIEFDASSLTSGVYFYKLQSGSFIETKKLILLR